MSCPLPLNRLAEEVPEIRAAYDFADFQAEYGISLEEWLWTNNEAQKMLETWWAKLDAKKQNEWIATYAEELRCTICDLQNHLDYLKSLI